MSLIRYVTRIHFAERVLEDALPEEMRARSIAAPLIVTDGDAEPSLGRLLDCLPAACRPEVLGLAGLDGPEAVTAEIRLALDERQGEGSGGSGRDALIGLGGMMALNATRMSPLRSNRKGAPPRSLPIFAVPTLPVCLGLSPVNTLARVRRGPTSACQVPDVVFCDPSLLQQAAPARLAVSGMDALIRCLEALLSNAWNPPADGMAFDGLRRAGDWLERLVADPHDAAAGREVLAAALNGSLAAQKGFGAIHALCHAFELMMKGAFSQGQLLGALVGPVLRFNAPAVPERMAAAAEALRLPDGGALAEHLTALAVRLGLPARLNHLGLTPARVERIARVAAEDRANRDNPRHATAADYRTMIEAAL